MLDELDRDHVARMCARFVVAMRLAGASTLALACSGSERPQDRPPDDPRGGQIKAGTEVTRSELPQGAWAVDYAKVTPSDLPSCPDGNFCIVGAREGAIGNARAPFDACAQTVPYPREPAPPDSKPGGPAFVGGPDINDLEAHYEIYFSADWTAFERDAKHPEACCYHWIEPCPGGRPLRTDDGSAILADVARDAAWMIATAHPVRDLARAQHWARAGRFEHASVAAFAHLSLQLLALGAPPHLIAACHRAALDEITHAQLAFGLAVAFGHEPIGPGPMPLPMFDRDVTPTDVLIETLRDGCVGETLAALQARRDLATAATQEERASLTRIADDEERHAELAFAIVAWLIGRFDELGDVLRRELDRLTSTFDPGARDVARAIVRPCMRTLSVVV